MENFVRTYLGVEKQLFSSKMAGTLKFIKFIIEIIKIDVPFLY